MDALAQECLLFAFGVATRRILLEASQPVSAGRVDAFSWMCPIRRRWIYRPRGAKQRLAETGGLLAVEGRV